MIRISTWQRIRDVLPFVVVSLFVAGGIEFISGNWDRFDSNAQRIHQLDPHTWTLKFSSVPPAPVSLSPTRMKSPCEIRMDNQVLSRSGSHSQIPSLMLSTPEFSVTNNSQITIACAHQAGFAGGVADQPFVISGVGLVWIELLRVGAFIFLGPLFSLLLLVQILGAGNKSGFRGASRENCLPVAAFGAISFLYFLSLGRVSWLYLDPFIATSLHIVARISFSWAFLWMVDTRRPIGKWFHYLFAMQLTSIAVAIWLSPDHVVMLYKYQYILFPLCTWIATVVVFRDDSATTEMRWLRSVLTVWAIAQSLDFFGNWIDAGTYKGPTLGALVALGVVLLHYKTLGLTEQVEAAVNEILAVLLKNRGMAELLSEVARCCVRATGFQRASVYIDGYCLGQNSKPGELLLEVTSFGHPEDRSEKTSIDFESPYGTKMKEALHRGSPITAKGDDKTWYCIIPIGRIGTLNLSDRRNRPVGRVSQSEVIVNRMLPALRTLEDKLVVHALRRGHFFDRVKTKLGYGEWPTRMGSIFLDVKDYSKNIRHYRIVSGGDDIYGKFVTSIYLPSLLKALGGLAELERSEGDLLYLVVADILQPSKEVDTGILTADVIRRIFEFVHGPGERLCLSAGFDPISIRMGANIGDANIVCDEYQVRSVGESINYAARLIAFAPADGLVCSVEFAPFFSSNCFIKNAPRDYLEKKDLIRAQTLYYDISSRSRQVV